jgi:hypothetical protein
MFSLKADLKGLGLAGLYWIFDRACHVTNSSNFHDICE